MKLQGSLACLLLALCLGRGAAGPLQGGGESTGHGVGEVYGHPGIEDQRDGEAASRIRELGETFNHGLEGAAHALENTGNEAGRLVENGIRHGVDAARSSEAWGTSGGHGMLGHSQGNLGGPGSPWGQGYPGGSEGSFGTNSLGGSSGQGGSGGSLNFGTNAQGAVAQPGYGSVRGSNQNSGCTNPPPSGSGGSSSNSGESSSSQGSGGGSSQGSGGGSSQGSGGGSSQGSGGGSSQGSGGSSSHGGSHGGSSSSHGGSSHGGSSSGGSSSGNSGSGSGSSSGASRERPLENSRDLDQSFSVSKGSDSGPSSGSSSGSSGGNKPECDNPGNEARLAPGGSGSQESREHSHLLGGSNHQGQGSSGDSGRGDGVSGLNTVNSQTSPGLFNFDTFWKNFKSKLGFINWDAIEKGRVPSPSTRALLYFRRLWENFKHKTPFFNWKEITEDADMSTLQKRAGGADQFSQPGSGRQEVPAVTSKNYNYNQQAYPTAYHGQFLVKTPAKGGVTISSSASRVQPGLLQWVKFW